MDFAIPLYGFENGLPTHQLFRRCVNCPPTSPQCPTCADNEQCIQDAGNCTVCPRRICVAKQEATGVAPAPSSAPSSGGGGSNVGVIAGSVAAGIVVIALITVGIWWFCIRGREPIEEEVDEEEYNSASEASENKAFDNTAERRHQSMHSVRSFASTVMSNVIQIAFIPGIQTRDEGGNVPPMPQMPQHLRNQNGNSPYTTRRGHPSSPYTDADSSTGDLCFTADDLRQSTYSHLTDGGFDQRRSVASSLARASFASTIVPSATPAQTVTRITPGMVSVKTTSPTGNVPDVPQVDYVKYGQIKKMGGARIVDSGASSKPSSPNPEAAGSPLAGQPHIASIAAGRSLTQAPSGAGAAAGPSQPKHKHSRSKGSKGSKDLKEKAGEASLAIQAAIEKATKRASATPRHGGLGSVGRPERRERDAGPFSDEHALMEEGEDSEAASYHDDPNSPAGNPATGPVSGATASPAAGSTSTGTKDDPAELAGSQPGMAM